MGINRAAVIDYASRYWNRPCDDGVFWLSNGAVVVEQKRSELKASARDGWEPFFVSDGNGGEQAVFQRTKNGTLETKLIQPWEGLADCAHFLSKCLQAGGVNVNERGVSNLVSTLRERSDTITLAERVAQEQGQRIIDTGIFKQGDMIGYFNVDPAGDWGGARSYSHSTLYAGKPSAGDPGRVTCHTVSRFPVRSFVRDEWFLHSGYAYTFVHFSGDDPTRSMPLATSLAGWWKVEYGSVREYSYVFRDGRARSTLKAPKTNLELHGAEESAHWFQKSNAITFIWRESGTVEVWAPGDRPRHYRVVVNGTPGMATKMF